MEPVAAVLGIVGVFVILALVFARIDGLSFLAPASTQGIRDSAEVFCARDCRTNGRCPLTDTADRAGDCALWKYVGADVPTALHGSPFATLHP